VAAQRAGVEIVDPRPFLDGSIADAFEQVSRHLRDVLPAMGYGDQQVKELEATMNRVDCDAVVIGTPIDLGRIIKIDKPHVRCTYSLEEIGKPDLATVLSEKIG
jgi:predicted GTPase